MDFNNLIHKGIMDNDRWIKMPLYTQIGNIGAEVSRLFHWKANANKKNADAALERALELIDLTVYGLQQSHNKAAMREILRFREVLCDSAGDYGFYGVTGEQLTDYCTKFMLIG